MPSQRLVLFIDYQNMYNGARRAFFSESSSFVCGQFKPIEFGELICSRPPPGITRKLEQVRIYTGRPDATKEAKAYRANMKQCSVWQKDGVDVIPRALRYPNDWPRTPAEEKGIDVTLAIDFVALAVDGKYDVGVIASTDTDMKPAMEFVNQRFGNSIHTEVVAWQSSTSRSRLSIPGQRIWCYWLKDADYTNIADLTDYTIDD
jgi:uncharacterized LabA/DUF88 family protein